MTPYEYKEMKSRKANLYTSLKKISDKKSARYHSKAGILDKINKQIADAEKEDPEIIAYLNMLKKCSRLRQTLGSWRYHKKDTSAIEAELNELSQKILLLEAAPSCCPIVVTQQEQPIVQQTTKPEPKVTQSPDPTYYIIKLAWSKGTPEDNVIKSVQEFLDMTEYVNTKKIEASDRGEYVYEWSFYYDSTEEQIKVKSLRMCAMHLLNVLKTWAPGVTDAEVFGKIQKY